MRNIVKMHKYSRDRVRKNNQNFYCKGKITYERKNFLLKYKGENRKKEEKLLVQ